MTNNGANILESFKKFYITQNLKLYIKWKFMKFLTTSVHDVYHKSVVLKLLAILFHN